MQNLKQAIKKPITAFVYDMLLIVVSWFISNLLIFGNEFFSYEHFFAVLGFLPLLVISQATFFWLFGLYRGMWRFASTPDLIRIVKAVAAGCILSLAIMFFLDHLSRVPRSFFFLYFMILVFLLGGSRLFYRYLKDHASFSSKGKRILIVGAGGAGEVLVRDLMRSVNHDYYPIGFVDDANDKQGKEIHGVRVLGVSNDIPKIVGEYGVELIVIAIPSARGLEMQRVVQLCVAARVPFQTLPSLSELASGKVTVNILREVAIEDLLGRAPVELDLQEIRSNIKGKVILVSGGGGSIGSELCRQIANLNPKTLVVIENSEFNLYQLEQEINATFPGLNLVLYLGSVVDKFLVAKIFRDNEPQIVFHAAAYKHVPILEDQAYTAIRNNVLGTKIMAETAMEYKADKFVLISTDKAVRPANIMGASKRLAEIVCQWCNKQNSATKFIAVRFGNVLGSSGSVIPLFRKQLAQGGPITVTHSEITRFFMTIPEAVQLILQAYALGQGGEVFVLDMGEPIKIKYLAEQMIRLSGREPGVDIDIVYTGLRPGEKMHEELFYKDEEMLGTKNHKIFQAKIEDVNSIIGNFAEIFNSLETMLYAEYLGGVGVLLQGLIKKEKA